MTSTDSTSRADYRYGELADWRLALALSAEDRAEAEGLDPLERITCRTHQRWLHQCIASPLHVIVVTGHRWCRPCGRPLSVAVDEFAGDVRLTCLRCGRTPNDRANRQILRGCRASLAAAHERGVPLPRVRPEADSNR